MDVTFGKPVAKGLYSNVSHCKYSVVRNCMLARNHKLIDEENDDQTAWNLWWQDTSVSADKVARLRAHQRINHWPGMACLHTKTGLASTLHRLATAFPEDFDFFPQTWALPGDWRSFTQQFDPESRRAKLNRTFIVKPAAACQGRGIYLTRKLDDIDPREHQVAQRYIAKPFLVEGLKFDLRIYIVVTSVEPLRVWLHEDGLCRFATQKYHAPTPSTLKESTMHLTNYAINKGSEGFVFNTDASRGDTGSKRTLAWFRGWLDANGYSSTLVWGRIVHTIVKMLLAAQPHLVKQYRTVVPSTGGDGSGPGGNNSSMRCFELLGLDVLLDHQLRPYLLEVNHSPSLTCDTPLDLDIKTRVIGECIDLLRLRTGDVRRTKAAEAAAARSRLFGSSNSLRAAFNTATAAAVGAASKAKVASGTGQRLLSSTGSSASLRSSADAGSSRPATAISGGSSSAASSRRNSGAGLADAGGTPPHVLATAPQFYDCAEAIPADHARHELKVSRGYRLIFPPPDPSLVDPAVWEGNAAGQKKMEAAGCGGCSADVGASDDGSGASPKPGACGKTSAGGDDAEEEDGTADDVPGIEVASSVVSAASGGVVDTPTASSSAAGGSGPVRDLASDPLGLQAALATVQGAAERAKSRISKSALKARSKSLRAQLDNADGHDDQGSASAESDADNDDGGEDDDDDDGSTVQVVDGSDLTSGPGLGRPGSGVRSRPVSASLDVRSPGKPPLPVSRPTIQGSASPAAAPKSSQSAARVDASTLPMRDGAPKPFYTPWDVSAEACARRLQQYRRIAAVSQHTYVVEMQSLVANKRAPVTANGAVTAHKPSSMSASAGIGSLGSTTTGGGTTSGSSTPSATPRPAVRPSSARRPASAAPASIAAVAAALIEASKANKERKEVSSAAKPTVDGAAAAAGTSAGIQPALVPAVETIVIATSKHNARPPALITGSALAQGTGSQPCTPTATTPVATLVIPSMPTVPQAKGVGTGGVRAVTAPSIPGRRGTGPAPGQGLAIATSGAGSTGSGRPFGGRRPVGLQTPVASLPAFASKAVSTPMATAGHKPASASTVSLAESTVSARGQLRRGDSFSSWASGGSTGDADRSVGSSNGLGSARALPASLTPRDAPRTTTTASGARAGAGFASARAGSGSVRSLATAGAGGRGTAAVRSKPGPQYGGSTGFTTAVRGGVAASPRPGTTGQGMRSAASSSKLSVFAPGAGSVHGPGASAGLAGATPVSRQQGMSAFDLGRSLAPGSIRGQW